MLKRNKKETTMTRWSIHICLYLLRTSSWTSASSRLVFKQPNGTVYYTLTHHNVLYKYSNTQYFGSVLLLSVNNSWQSPREYRTSNSPYNRTILIINNCIYFPRFMPTLSEVWPCELPTPKYIKFWYLLISNYNSELVYHIRQWRN